jgi:malate dehydrogenase (oxaloacetate-decarboxylating)(NADP+)
MKILKIEVKTAARVAKVVFENNPARVERPADLEAFIRSRVYMPEYRSLI